MHARPYVKKSDKPHPPRYGPVHTYSHEGRRSVAYYTAQLRTRKGGALAHDRFRGTGFQPVNRRRSFQPLQLRR